jgi:hypothetical protein
MISNGQLDELEQFRVVLIFSWTQKVLVEEYGERRQLPRVNIRRWTRPAEQLSATLRAKWGVQSILIDLLPKSDELPPCAVIEIRNRDWKISLDGFESVSVGEIDERELTTQERPTVCSIIAGDTQGRGPFSKLGWVEEAQEWIQESMATHRVDFSDDVRQFNVGGSFALIRFGTVHGPAFWLKATSAPNAHEFLVTQTIARYCPQFLPPLIAARTDWNAWVTEEVGQPLHDTVSLHAFRQSTRCLAEMQILSAAYVRELLACGCFDQRKHMLRAHLPNLMQYLEKAMTRQTSVKVLPLSIDRLQELGNLLVEGCVAMESIDVPDTLIHNDMNPGNILFDGKRAVFTDWSEAGVGNPFLTFQHLRVQALEADETHTWAQQMEETYKGCWSSVLRESSIERAFALSPPLAIVSYLLGRDPSFDSSDRADELVLSYTRSLARHMDRCAKSPAFLEALCS